MHERHKEKDRRISSVTSKKSVHSDVPDRFSAVPEAEQSGWLKDRSGVSWPITPVALGETMKSKDQKKLDRVTQAFLKMKKFDLKKLQAAYERT